LTLKCGSVFIYFCCAAPTPPPHLHRAVEELQPLDQPAALHRRFALRFAPDVRTAHFRQLLLAQLERNRVHVARVAFARHLPGKKIRPEHEEPPKKKKYTRK
jgi:hypothetical protein